ncbi:MAG: beta-CASP ribonuclease aCPSF1 [Candidatus Heimdallarchaeota archaeon]|nr:beta-CASP ribonuclease aCPSF1 [Candidatus Heimdallarchaeota archaeon]MCK4290250.1 beta-CASP ribonuclease aCPSF1 [Candidatus Heimdallarchaeota archaeon]
MSQETLNEIKSQILAKTPPSADITEIEFEGPEVAVYSRNPQILVDNGELVKNLAKELRKRIVIRSDPSVRKDQAKATTLVKELVPEEAEISSIQFDPNIGEILIEAAKPGLVIGKNGATLRKITSETFWRPNVSRAPPLESRIIKTVRDILFKNSEERKKILRKVGRRIHRKQMFPTEWVRITSLGGYREVGRSATLLRTPESSILIDCGVNVGRSTTKDMFPRLDTLEFSIENLDAVVITHAHLDHCGFLPYLYKYGYEGPVYTTKATSNLMTLLQIDYLDVAKKEGKMLPYASKDVRNLVLHTIPLSYGEVTDISPDVRLTLHNAGHILGSAIVHLHIGNGLYNIAIAQDFKYRQTNLLDPAVSKFPRLEALFMESTYGNPQDVMPTNKEAETQLMDIIGVTLNRGGKVLIPVLAVGRAQELQIVLESLMARGMIPKVPIYLDGMISEASAVTTCHPEYLSRKLREKIFHVGQNPFLAECFHKVEGRDERAKIILGDPCIVLATSGMLTGGPSVEYFDKLSGGAKNSLIFVSYQGEGSLGRKVQKNVNEITVMEKGHARVLKIEMEIHTVIGFSGHSDRRELLNYARKATPRPEKIFLIHGEKSKCISLASTLHKMLKVETKAPDVLETVRLV